MIETPLAHPAAPAASLTLPDGAHFLAGDALAPIYPAWDALARDAAASPMARREWAQAYLESFACDEPAKVLVAALVRGGELQALLPLVTKRLFGLRYLELLSCSELYEPTEILFRSPQALRELLDATLKHCRMPLVFERHPEHAPSLEVMAHSLRCAHAMRRSLRPHAPRLPLGEDPEQILNAGRRSDLRRMLRRAEKYGPVSFELLQPSAQELPALLAQALGIEAAGWKGAQQTALMQDEGPRRFFESYARHASQAGIFRLAFMRINEQPVAAQLNVVCGGAVWLFKIGYDEAYAHCSPGNLLMMEVLRQACAERLHACEFLGLAAGWTRAWTSLEYATERIVLYPSRLSQLRHTASLAAQRLASRLRPASQVKFAKGTM